MAGNYIAVDPTLQVVYYSVLQAGTDDIFRVPYRTPNVTPTRVYSVATTNPEIRVISIPGRGFAGVYGATLVRGFPNGTSLIIAGTPMPAGYTRDANLIAYNPVNDTIFWYLYTSWSNPTGSYLLEIPSDGNGGTINQNTTQYVLWANTCTSSVFKL